MSSKNNDTQNNVFNEYNLKLYNYSLKINTNILKDINVCL